MDGSAGLGLSPSSGGVCAGNPATSVGTGSVQTDALEKATGKRTWLTEDGPVVIEAKGDTVLITESVDQLATEKLEQDVFGTAATAAR